MLPCHFSWILWPTAIYQIQQIQHERKVQPYPLNPDNAVEEEGWYKTYHMLEKQKEKEFYSVMPETTSRHSINKLNIYTRWKCKQNKKDYFK